MATTLERAISFSSHAEEFSPRRFFSNGHLQTILGNFLPRVHKLPPPQTVLVDVSPASATQLASRVRCDCHWQPEAVRASCPTAIIVHGLEGSSNSQYVVGNASKLWEAGGNVIRMNMRNCGGTEALTPTLYHSGLSSDVDAVMRHFIARHNLQSISLIGYSMGGNLVLKLAGDLGDSAPSQLKTVVGVSPAIDLGQSADALHLPWNRPYEIKFLRALLGRYRRKVKFFPRAYDPARTDGVRSIRDFDERITAFYSGFTSADDYYFRAAAARVLDRIAVPALILSSADDPFIRFTAQSRSLIDANPNITFIETAHGGHCAFLATANTREGYDGYWAEHTLMNFLLSRS